MNFSIECEEETDGRWLAEVQQLPGVLCYGATASQAIAKVEALALRALAERVDQEEERSRLIREALADVDAGRVIDHQAVQAWAVDLIQTQEAS